ncbi:MAG: mucoidy inhibitor MuiA family protein [Planctomycetota bacterium]
MRTINSTIRFLTVLTAASTLALAADSGAPVPNAPPEPAKAAPAKAAEAPDAPPVKRVTAYEDRALVTRAGKVEVAAGKTSLVLKGLPVNLDENTLRAKSLSPEAKLVGVTTILENVREEAVAKVKDLREAIESKQREVQTVQDEFQALSVREQKLNEYREYVREAISETTTVQNPEVAKWTEAVEFLRTEPERIAAKRRELTRKQEDLQKELGILMNQLRQIQSQPERTIRLVTCAFESSAGGAAEIEISYLIGGVSWRPEYDARWDEQKKTIEFGYVGTVAQKTGEDWTGVELSLSTARPSIGAKRPEVALLLLQGVKIEKPKEVKLEEAFKDIEKDQKGGEPPASPSDNVAAPLARLDDKGTSVTLTLTNPATVPSDARPHKVQILTVPLPTEVVMETVPKMKPFAFHKATAKNQTGYPLLAGPVNVFRSSGFIGTGSVEYVPAGGEFSVSLGADDEVKVRRTFDRRLYESPKFLRSTKLVTYAYDFEIRNHKSAPQRIVLVENIPVSELAAVEVSFESSLKPTEHKKDKGILKWDLTLAAGEKKAFRLTYTITMPKDHVPPPGM